MSTVYDFPFAHAAILVTVIVVVVVIRHLARQDPLRNVPGPWLARYTSLLLAYYTRTGKRYLYIDSMHKKYGRVVRITPRQASVTTPDAPSTIYAQGAAALPKSSFYRAFWVSGTPSLFSTQNRAGHAARRRMWAHPFSYNGICDFEGWIRISLGKFVRGLDRAVDGPDIEVLRWFNYMAFDVISDLAFGRPLGMLDRGTDVLVPARDRLGVADMIDYRSRTAAFLGHFPFLLPPHRISSPIIWFLREIFPDPFIRRGLNCTDTLSGIARKCIRDRLNAGLAGRRGDLLDRLVDGLRREDQHSGKGLNEDEIMTEAMLLLTAGSDTTANSTGAILFHILKNPRVLSCLRSELSTIGELQLGDDGLALPSHDQVKNLKYLQATIDEGLRTYATNAVGLPRVVPPGTSVSLAGYTFPEGVELSAPAWNIQHDPQIWGDPEVFRPERWLEGKDMKRHLLIFGMGPRSCLGKNLAIMQMQLLIATLIMRYDFELLTETLESFEGFMRRPLGLWVHIHKRTACTL